jgi:hypothetical protein
VVAPATKHEWSAKLIIPYAKRLAMACWENVEFSKTAEYSMNIKSCMLVK